MKAEFLIVDIEFLKPLEYVFPTHLANLENMIGDIMEKPILVDKETGIVLDGSHRYALLMKRGYGQAPVVFVDYSDENVRVGSRLKHRFLIDSDDSVLLKKECVDRGLSGNLFPPRTTRHFFPFRKENIPTDLRTLKRGEERDISHLIAKVSVGEEIRHNEQYISEIEEEIEIIAKYLAEVTETKQYLKKQISQMKKVAFFPGKFHPPHIGHIATILGLLKEYDRVVIGVSGDMPEDAIMSQDEIFDIFMTTFYSHNVDIVAWNGKLIDQDKDWVDDVLPHFDILVSGNEEVLKWATSIGLKNELVPRTFQISARDLRASHKKLLTP